MTWKPLPNFENQYEISIDGQVRRRYNTKQHKAGSLLKPMIDRFGYHRYQLWDRAEKKRKGYSAHRLVYEAFSETIPGNQEINHIDGNKANNHLDNLEVVTHRQNIKHSFTKLDRRLTIPRGSQTGTAKLTETDIPKIRRYLAQGKSQRWIAAQFKVSHVTIGQIARGYTWTHV